MSAVIRLHVYSGVPDPVWAIEEGAARDLYGMLEAADASAVPDTGGLGYRGFSILGTGAAEDAFGQFSSTGSDDTGGSLVLGIPHIESFLLETAGSRIDDELAGHVRSAIESGPAEPLDEALLDAVSCPPNGGADAPTYDPAYWNNNPTRKRNNNCYAYANNQATNTFPQPGRGSGTMFSALACGGSTGVEAASVRDGLRPVPTFAASIPSGWYVALVVWPGRDYHWYRQDDNGCWSHKPGQTAVRNVDNSGTRITDPNTCDRGPYTDFCTYMVTQRTVTIA